MSPVSSPLRRLVALLALAALTSVLLVLPGSSAVARDDSALAEAAAAVEAAKAEVERTRAANKDALAHRDRARDRLARRAEALELSATTMAGAEHELDRARNRVAAARERLARAETPRARYNARQYLRTKRELATQRRTELSAARSAYAAAVDAVDRATATLTSNQTTLDQTRLVLAAARQVLADAKAHYADLLELASSEVITAVANIPNRISAGNFSRSMSAMVANEPDFITLNEIGGRSLEALQAAAPGYAVYRGGARLTGPGAASQSLNNAVLWRTDGYELVTQGRLLVVDDDRGYHNGNRFLWDRYATWVTVRNLVDGQLTSVISTHMPTNPAKFPRQWGNPPMTRVQLSALGMDRLAALAGQLALQGRVLLAGDMNSHPNQGAWAAAPKMAKAGYGFTKDRGVMYLFHSNQATVPSSRQLSISSDHPALLTTVLYGDASAG